MTHTSEPARIHALQQLGLIETSPSESFDRITRMAGQIFSLDTSAISLTDSDRQWFMSRLGVADTQMPRHDAPCNEVTQTNAPLIVPDLLANPRYADSTLAGTGARFYAGSPLITREGHCLGSLCVVGSSPRTATEQEMAALDDLAAMVMAQIELRHAYGRVDPISGLGNRNQFIEDLEDLARDHPGEGQQAVIVDLARNSELESVGRVVGPAYVDEIVRNAVRMLTGCLPDGCKLYHVASTQLAFLMPSDADEDILARAAARLTSHRTDAEVDFATTPALGMTPFILGKMTPQDVLRTSYSAAQDSREGEQSVSVYSSETDAIHRRRFGLLSDFASALRRSGELHLVYQPRVDLKTGNCVGAEALLRWRHPDLGDVSPGEFIPLVEQTSLVRKATSWVLDKAIRQQAAWKSKGLLLNLSINISAANLRETDLAQRVQLYLLKHRVEPGSIELELTESALIDGPGSARDQLAALNGAGISVAIDDFGTGYSSLSYLQTVPAQVVKIDQTFIRRLKAGSKEYALVRSMICLSHDLGFRVVAEGVEHHEALRALREMACDEAQGYLFSRPLEADQFEAWLHSSSADALLRRGSRLY